MEPKIKLSCVAIIDRCTVPHAVIVADVKRGRDGSARYVLLDSDVREALSRMRHEGRDVLRYADVLRSQSYAESLFPSTIRTHAFDARGELMDEEPLAKRTGIWTNAETLWIRMDLAQTVLADLEWWRSRNPRREGAIWAPNWLALIGVQSLAIAAGIGTEGVES